MFLLRILFGIAIFFVVMFAIGMMAEAGSIFFIGVFAAALALAAVCVIATIRERKRKAIRDEEGHRIWLAAHPDKDQI